MALDMDGGCGRVDPSGCDECEGGERPGQDEGCGQDSRDGEDGFAGSGWGGTFCHFPE